MNIQSRKEMIQDRVKVLVEMMAYLQMNKYIIPAECAEELADHLRYLESLRKPQA